MFRLVYDSVTYACLPHVRRLSAAMQDGKKRLLSASSTAHKLGLKIEIKLSFQFIDIQ